MRSVPPEDGRAAGVYVHFPFCSRACSYCDFVTVHGQDERVDAYLAALSREIREGQRPLPGAVDSVYFGGGTPSRMTSEQVRRLLAVIRERFGVSPDAEVTIEGNPEDLTTERLAGFRAAGITRVSVGVQSLDDRVLAGVGRAHDGAQAAAAVAAAREAGLRAVSLDLIAGLPGERMSRWAETIRRVVELGPDHVSVYLLETDKDTPVARAIHEGRVAAGDADALGRAYEETTAVLEQADFSAYEISSFARAENRSRHNLKYWTDAPYGGFGPGAHSYCAGNRRANVRDLDAYIETVSAGRDPIAWEDPWEPERRVSEALILGLRMAVGVDLDRLGERYEEDLWARYATAWARATEAGLIVRDGSRLRLTLPGRLRSNELFADLI